MDTRPAPVNLNQSFSVDGVWQRLQFALLPARCLLCAARSDRPNDLCGACLRDLSLNEIACERCALPLPSAASMCGECLRREPPFDATFAPYLYGHPFDLLMTKLKFGHNLASGRVLSELWITAMHRALHSGRIARLPDCLIPVPLHTSRLRERGYNQALELAKPLARQFAIALAPDLLIRSRATSAQSDLDAKARRKNLRGAFEIDKSAWPEKLRSGKLHRRAAGKDDLPQHVVILDDVMTTGATLRECARTLKQAGVARVDVWALARAPRLR